MMVKRLIHYRNGAPESKLWPNNTYYFQLILNWCDGILKMFEKGEEKPTSSSSSSSSSAMSIFCKNSQLLSLKSESYHETTEYLLLVNKEYSGEMFTFFLNIK